MAKVSLLSTILCIKFHNMRKIFLGEYVRQHLLMLCSVQRFTPELRLLFRCDH